MRDPLARVSVGVKLTATFVILGVISFGVGGFLISGPSRRALEQEVLGRLESESVAEARLLDAQLALLARRLEDFSSDGYIRTELTRLSRLATIAPEERGPLLKHLRTNKMPLIGSLVDLALWDEAGRRVCWVNESEPPHAEVSLPGRRSDRLWIGDFVGRGDLRETPAFAVTAPVMDLAQAGRIGTIVAWVDVARWLRDAGTRAERALDPEDHVVVFLRDGAGNLLDVPAPDQAAPLRLSALGAEAASALARGHEGRHPCRNGQTALGRSYSVPLNGWTVTVERDAAAALAVVSGLESRFVTIGAGIAALCGVLFFFPLRFLVKPLASLEEGARRLQAGDYRGRVAVESEDELGHLAAAFNHMAAAVEERTKRLELAAEDLRARKDELKSERDRLGLVIRSMSDGLVFLDAQGGVALANDAATPLVAALERGAGGLLDRECGDRGAATCAACLGEARGPARACVVETPSAVLEVRSSPLPTGGRVLVARDVTERVAHEARQMHQERLAVIGEVAAVVAHELNNPLAAISMFVQMLETEIGPASPFQEHVDVISRNVLTCKKTIRGLLEYASAADPERAEVDVHELLQDAGQLLAPLRRREKVELSWDLAAVDAALRADQIQLRQLFVNLLVNAIQATAGRGGSLRVSTREDDDGRALVIDVQDDGPGVPAELRSRIFEAFFTTKRPGSGTGLGLPISRRIAEAHGGSLELLESVPGRTVFRVRLPREHRGSPRRGRPLPVARATP